MQKKWKKVYISLLNIQKLQGNIEVWKCFETKPQVYLN